MKISKKTDYALRILLELSINYEKCKTDNCVRMKDISKKHSIPYKFLQQIVLTLKKLGYVKTIQGVKGGICLNKPPKEIILGDVIAKLEGTIMPISCLDKSFVKCSEENCVFKVIWQELYSVVDKIVNNINFEELANKYKSQSKQVVYYI